MKRQLDRLKGKRLVTGDPNLMTKDEICINATPNGVEVKEIGTDGKIKDLAGSSEGSSEGGNGFQYKSAKRYWTIPYNGFTEISWDLAKQIFTMMLPYIPKYSAYEKIWEGSGPGIYNKYYAYLSESAVVTYVSSSTNSWHQLYFEEAYIDKELLFSGNQSLIPTVENFIEFFKNSGLDLSSLFVEITEEEYLSGGYEAERGKELVNE